MPRNIFFINRKAHGYACTDFFLNINDEEVLVKENLFPLNIFMLFNASLQS